MKRVLVTGGSGFVGRHVVPLLTGAGWDVVTVRRADADLRNPAESAALVDRVKPSHVLHLAWNAQHGQYWTAPDNEQWVDGTVAMARAFAARGGRRFVAAGTCAEYDWTSLSGPCTEDITPVLPRTIYGRAKLRACQGIARALDEARISWSWGRLFFLYGPGEDERRLVPSVVRALRSGQRAKVSAGTQVRDFLHVSDAALAFAALLDGNLPGPVNIGSGVPVTIREIVESLARFAGRPDAVDFGAVPMREGDPPLLVASITRLRSLGWQPATTLAAGLADSVRRVD
jgi:nucleoside-diphosphate-sugar epimerase